MLRAALPPSTIAGALAVVGVGLWRGSGAWAGALLGLAVALAVFVSGMVLMSRLVRSASPLAFFAVAMSVYFAQVIALLLFLIVFLDAAWLDGLAFGVTAGVVVVVWQVAAIRAMRHIPVYDPQPEPGDEGTDGPGEGPR